jgi:hypothetical protein
MLGRTPPAAPQPPPQPQPTQAQPDADIDYNFDDSVDPRFEEWDEAFVEDAKVEAADAA